MLLGDALSKSKIAMLRLADRLVLVTNTAAYEATLKEQTWDRDAWIFNNFTVVQNFNNIPDSKEWEALGYHEK